MKIVLTATVTLTDMISNVGGIMGLFSGNVFLVSCRDSALCGKLLYEQNEEIAGYA